MTLETDILPNGPARLVTDLRKDKFRLDYAGAAILQVTVRLRRGETLLSLRDGGARLIAISKSEGWDRVTQTVRASAVALSPGDTLLMKGTICAADRAGVAPVAVGEGALQALMRRDAHVICPIRDFQIQFEPAIALTWLDATDDERPPAPTVDGPEALRNGPPAGRPRKLAFEATVDELIITFRPQFSRYHR